MTDATANPSLDPESPSPSDPTTGDNNSRSDAPKAHDRRRAQTLQRTILRKSLRRRRARLGADDSVWVWLGTFGLVGWTVMMPTLAGLALGIFLDNRIETSFSFAITFLIVGVAVGTSMAWYWVRQESEQGDEL